MHTSMEMADASCMRSAQLTAGHSSLIGPSRATAPARPAAQPDSLSLCARGTPRGPGGVCVVVVVVVVVVVGGWVGGSPAYRSEQSRLGQLHTRIATVCTLLRKAQGTISTSAPEAVLPRFLDHGTYYFEHGITQKSRH